MSKRADTAENILDQIHFTEDERMEKLLAQRDASSTRFPEIFVSLRKIIRGREEKKDKAADMLTTVKRLYEQGRSIVVSIRGKSSWNRDV